MSLLLLAWAAASEPPQTIPLSSSQFDAVLTLPADARAPNVPLTLHVADFATSEPVSGAVASMTLAGPATAAVTFTPNGPGAYAGIAPLPTPGHYAGALLLQTPTTGDLLAVNDLSLADPPLDAPAAFSASGAPAVLGIVIAAGFAAVVALAALGIGYAIGRRRGAGAAAALLLGLAAREGFAHGGEDHGAPAIPTDTTGLLHLPLPSQFLLGLRTLPLVHAPFQEQVPAFGRFVARAGGSATLRSPVAGEILAPPGGFPSPGASVHAGQVLATVREGAAGADRAALAEARQSAAMAAAEAAQALALAERDEAQVPQLGDVLTARERFVLGQATAAARVAVAEADRTLTALREGAAIRAPVAGKLGSVLARPGDQVQAGDPLFRVIDASDLWVEARVPERLAVGLLAGSSAQVHATALPDSPFPAILLDGGQEADPATAALTVTLAVDAPALDLRPGMSATAWLGRGPIRDVLVVPDAAVVESNGMRIGFVKVGPEQFALRELRLGGRSGAYWEVLEGVSVGERIVIDGTYALRSLAGR